MEKKKLKKKIWITATAILLTYTTILILNPTIWVAILPIIIPTGILTVGLPTYAIIKSVKDSLEQKNKKQDILTQEKNIETAKNIRIKEEITTNNIIKENNATMQLETQYKQDTNVENKPKIKTKGTIH